jgi:hypothetical protein
MTGSCTCTGCQAGYTGSSCDIPPPVTPPPPAPQCTLSTLPLENNGRWSTSSTGTFTAGSMTTLSCNPGYQPSPVNGQQATLTCTSTGQWDVPAAPCTPAAQPPPPTPPCILPGEYNGRWTLPSTGTFTVGSQTILSCNPGYQPSTQFGQDSMLTCTSTGQWSHSAAQCTPAAQPPPPTPPCSLPVENNGRWLTSSTGTLTAGSTITLSCNSGYQPSAGSGQQTMLTCTSTGLWSNAKADCRAAGPPPPPTPTTNHDHHQPPPPPPAKESGSHGLLYFFLFLLLIGGLLAGYHFWDTKNGGQGVPGLVQKAKALQGRDKVAPGGGGGIYDNNPGDDTTL